MDEKRKSNGALWVTLSILIIVLFYPLSVGPFIWLVDHDLLPHRVTSWLLPVYLPLDDLAESKVIPVLPGLMSWYCSLWLQVIAH